MSEKSTRNSDCEMSKKVNEFSSSPIEMNDPRYRMLVHLLAVNWDRISPVLEDSTDAKWKSREFMYILQCVYGKKCDAIAGRGLWGRFKEKYWDHLMQDVNYVRESQNILEALNNVFAPVNCYYYNMYTTFCQNLIALRSEEEILQIEHRRIIEAFFNSFNESINNISHYVLELGLPPPEFSLRDYIKFNSSLKTYPLLIARMKFAHYFLGEPHVMPRYIPTISDIVIPNNLEDVNMGDDWNDHTTELYEQRLKSSLLMEDDIVDGIYRVLERCSKYALSCSPTVFEMAKVIREVISEIILEVSNRHLKPFLRPTNFNEACNTSLLPATTVATSATTATATNLVSIGATTSYAATSTADSRSKPTATNKQVISSISSFVPTTRGKYSENLLRKYSSMSINRRETPRTSSTVTSETVQETTDIGEQLHAPVGSTVEMVGCPSQYFGALATEWQSAQESITGGLSASQERYLREAAAVLETQADRAEEQPTRIDGHFEEVPREQKEDVAKSPCKPYRNHEQPPSTNSTAINRTVEGAIEIRQQLDAPVATTTEMVGWPRQYPGDAATECQPGQEAIAGETSAWRKRYLRETAAGLDSQADRTEELPIKNERHIEEVPREEGTDAATSPRKRDDSHEQPPSANNAAFNRTLEETIEIRKQLRAPTVSIMEMDGWSRQFAMDAATEWQPEQEAIARESSTWLERSPREAAAEAMETQAYISEELPIRNERHIQEVPREQETDVTKSPRKSDGSHEQSPNTDSTAINITMQGTIEIKQQLHAPEVSTVEIAGWPRQYYKAEATECQPAQEASIEGLSAWRERYLREAAVGLEMQEDRTEELPARNDTHIGEITRAQDTDVAKSRSSREAAGEGLETQADRTEELPTKNEQHIQEVPREQETDVAKSGPLKEAAAKGLESQADRTKELSTKNEQRILEVPTELRKHLRPIYRWPELSKLMFGLAIERYPSVDNLLENLSSISMDVHEVIEHQENINGDIQEQRFDGEMTEQQADAPDASKHSHEKEVTEPQESALEESQARMEHGHETQATTREEDTSNELQAWAVQSYNEDTSEVKRYISGESQASVWHIYEEQITERESQAWEEHSHEEEVTRQVDIVKEERHCHEAIRVQQRTTTGESITRKEIHETTVAREQLQADIEDVLPRENQHHESLAREQQADAALNLPVQRRHHELLPRQMMGGMVTDLPPQIEGNCQLITQEQQTGVPVNLLSREERHHESIAREHQADTAVDLQPLRERYHDWLGSEQQSCTVVDLSFRQERGREVVEREQQAVAAVDLSLRSIRDCEVVVMEQQVDTAVDLSVRREEYHVAKQGEQQADTVLDLSLWSDRHYEEEVGDQQVSIGDMPWTLTGPTHETVVCEQQACAAEESQKSTLPSPRKIARTCSQKQMMTHGQFQPCESRLVNVARTHEQSPIATIGQLPTWDNVVTSDVAASRRNSSIKNVTMIAPNSSFVPTARIVYSPTTQRYNPMRAVYYRDEHQQPSTSSTANTRIVENTNVIRQQPHASMATNEEISSLSNQLCLKRLRRGITDVSPTVSQYQSSSSTAGAQWDPQSYTKVRGDMESQYVVTSRKISTAAGQEQPRPLYASSSMLGKFNSGMVAQREPAPVICPLETVSRQPYEVPRNEDELIDIVVNVPSIAGERQHDTILTYVNELPDAGSTVHPPVMLRREVRHTEQNVRMRHGNHLIGYSERPLLSLPIYSPNGQYIYLPVEYENQPADED